MALAQCARCPERIVHGRLQSCPFQLGVTILEIANMPVLSFAHFCSAVIFASVLSFIGPYTKFVAQGGDWGAIITELMGMQAPPELLGIHTNMPNVIPLDIDKLAFSGAPAPANLSTDEKLAYDRLSFVYAKGIGYGFQMGLRPQTLYGIGVKRRHPIGHMLKKLQASNLPASRSETIDSRSEASS
jgi:hypothetical protein